MPQDSLLKEPSSVVMLSGGIDSVAVLKQVLKETDEKIYAHHIHIKNNEGPNNIKRYKAEALALRKIVPYMKKNFRDFHYSESTIDVRQIFSITQFLNITTSEEEQFVLKYKLIPDDIYYYFIGGLLAKTTNSDNTYTGDINILSPKFYSYADKNKWRNKRELKDDSEVYANKLYNVSDWIFRNKRKINIEDECNISLSNNPLSSEIDSIFHTTAWPHKSNLRRPFYDNEYNYDTIKKRNIEYIGKELMDMSWYCRYPLEKNRKIFSCNNIYGFYHEGLDDKTGQIYKCKSCLDVTNIYLELREEQQRIH